MIDDVYPASHLGPVLSVIVIVVVVAVLLVMATLALVRAFKRRAMARAAEASFDPLRILAPGEAVLQGIVEHAEDEGLAVRVEVTQVGEEKESSGSWSHSWKEVDRSITVRPFYLRLTNGDRVRIEPPDDVDVADDLDGKVLIARDRRVLSAELVPGELIFARGRLEQAPDPEAKAAGYRGGARGWRLIPDDGRMLLSSHPLGEGLRHRARFHRNAALQVVGALLAFQVVLLPYYACAAGAVEEATVTYLNVRAVEDDDGTTYHHDVGLRFADGVTKTTEVGKGDHGRLKVGFTVAVLRGPHDWQIGARPTLHTMQVILGLGGALALAIVQASRRVSTRPWYRRKVEQSGSGRLSDPA